MESNRLNSKSNTYHEKQFGFFVLELLEFICLFGLVLLFLHPDQNKLVFLQTGYTTTVKKVQVCYISASCHGEEWQYEHIMQEEQLLHPKYFNSGEKNSYLSHSKTRKTSKESGNLPAESETYVLLIHFRVFWIYFLATHANNKLKTPSISAYAMYSLAVEPTFK